MDALIQFRRELHRFPELSGGEQETSRRVLDLLQTLRPDRLLDNLGGYGVAAVFDGATANRTLLLRCELDALPIAERSGLPFASQHPGVAHLCGHDGHMAILAGLGFRLAQQRPERARVVLLFQPAEETGAGAQRVLTDPRFASLRPDLCLALHNIPGMPLGQLLIREGTFCCASQGMTVKLHGRSAHAASPQTGASPLRAACGFIDWCHQMDQRLTDGTMLTVVGTHVGEKTFGTTAEAAHIWVTLRADTDARMSELTERCQQAAQQLADEHGLQSAFEFEDVFPATMNSGEAVQLVEQACTADEPQRLERPFPWSEDFGHFTKQYGGALLGIGAGASCHALHDPHYEFPEELIPIAIERLWRITQAFSRQSDSGG